MSDSKLIAQDKVERALKFIEMAQTALGNAASELCPVTHAAKQWSCIGDMYDRTRALWHEINETIPRSLVDLADYAKRAHEPKETA